MGSAGYLEYCRCTGKDLVHVYVMKAYIGTRGVAPSTVRYYLEVSGQLHEGAALHHRK